MFLCLAGALLVLGPADMLERAKAAYDDYEFDKAAAYYRDALALGIADENKLADARLEYAFAIVISDPKNRAEAKRQLRLLFILRPDHTLADKGLHPDLVKLYTAERKAFDEERAKKARELAARPAEAPPPAALVAKPPPSPPLDYQPGHWALRLLPLGIGQFANGDVVGGAIFLSSELALLATHVAFVFLQERSREPGAGFEYSDPNALAYWDVRSVAGAALIAVALGGIVDAFVWSPERGRARAQLRVTPVAFVGGAGLSAHLSFY